MQPNDVCPGPLLTVRPDGSDVQLSGSDDLGFDAAGTSLAWVGNLGEQTGFSISRGERTQRVVRFGRGFEIFPCSQPEGAAPQVSPDGKFVVYADGKGSPEATNLYLVSARGQDTPRHLMHGVAIQGMVWSPESTTIAVTTSEGVYLVDIARPRPRLIPASGRVAWSPNGQRLALASGDLDLIDRDGRNLRRLVKSDTGISDVSWAPAGTIAFVENTGDNNQDKCQAD